MIRTRFVLAIVCLALGVDLAAQKAFPVTPLPEVRNLHGACVAGDWLVVAGGAVTTQAAASADVLVAHLDPDRQLGPWTPSTALPETRLYISNSVVSQGNNVLVVGGEVLAAAADKSEVKTYSNTLLYSHIDATGTVAPWMTSAEMPGAGGVGCAAATNDRLLYVTGGQLGDDTVSAAFCYAALDPFTGAPGDFQAGPALPTPLWFHASIATNERLYVAGGRATTDLATTGDVIFCDLDEDGTPGSWKHSPAAMAFPVNNFAFQGVGGFLVAAGGRGDANALSDRLQYAKIIPDGTAEWTETSGAIEPLYYAAAAYAPSISAMYLIGGRRTLYVAATTADVTCIGLRNSNTTEGDTAAPAPEVLEFPQALAKAKEEGKPLLLVCYSSQVPRSVDFCKSLAVALTPEDSAVAVTGYVDLAKDLDMATKLEVFRPPVYILMSPEGEVQARSETFPELTPSMFLKEKLKGS